MGDCYFLCAMSAIAEYPDRVKALFRTQEINAAGIYEVDFFIAGKETTVYVDDYIPCNEND